MMWDTLSAPWQACLEQAWEAYRAGSIPIGAAIAGPDGRVLSTGRNRLKEPREVQDAHLAGTRLAHAEINALLAFQYSGEVRLCTLYTTTEPCPMCAGAMVMSNLRRVCFASRDPNAGATHLYQASPYLRRKEISVLGPDSRGAAGALLEAVLIALQGEFFMREAVQRGKGTLGAQAMDGLLLMMAETCPSGIALAERLYHDHSLQHLATAGVLARVVIDLLAEQVERFVPAALAEDAVR